jgi:membrane protein implicated in regulation of membrane protease activity
MDAILGIYESQPFWTWVGLAAALLTIEIVTGTGWLLWAAAAAGVTALFTSFLAFPGELLVFALATMASTLLARRYFPRSEAAGGPDINDAVGRLVGRQGAAVAAFKRGEGRVFIDGKEWAAELEEGQTLDAGAPVQVIGVDGARLRVRHT